MLKTCFCETFTGDLSCIRGKLKMITVYLKEEFGLSDEEKLSELRTILTELIINAVIHGNKRSLEKSVWLFVEIEGDTLISTVKDEGAGYDYRKNLSFKGAGLKEHGRGLLMALSLSDGHEWNDCGNEITIYKKI